MIEADNQMQQDFNEAKSKNIVFFDGVCNLCNATVDFIIKRDKGHNLYFASLQSDFAKKFLSEHTTDFAALKTVYYYENGNLYHKSEAVFRLLKQLNPAYKFLGNLLLLLPSFLPNSIYNIIARIRYRLLGKRTTCRVPSQAEEKMFLG